MFLEAGFARTRETVNVLLEVSSNLLCGLLFWAFGFAFMFGSGNGFIGLSTSPARRARDLRATASPCWPSSVPDAFADTCSTITSGAMIGRCGFWATSCTASASALHLPIIGTGLGPDGWLNTIHRPRSTTSPARRSSTRSRLHLLAGHRARAAPRRKFKRDGGGPCRSRHDIAAVARHPLVRVVRLQTRQHAVA